MKLRWWMLVLIVVVVLAGGYGGYRLLGRRPEAASAEIEVETAVVERGTLRMTVDAGGSLAPLREVALVFESGGEVVEVVVESGDLVAAGDVLARLDDEDARRSVTDAELQVEKARLSLASAQLELDDLLTWEPDEDAVELAEANLAAAYADYRTTVASNALVADQLMASQVNLNQAQRALDDAVDDYDSAYDPGRDWELGDRRLGPRLEDERESVSDQLARAQEDVQVAQAAYNLDVAGVSDSSVKNAWSKVVNAEITLEDEQTAPDDDTITAAQLQVSQAEVSLAQAELQLASAEAVLADTVLTAPVPGTVTAVDLEVGQRVSAGQAAATLADLSTLVVEIGLDEVDIALVSVGQETIVLLDAFDDVELRGKITHIAPTAEVQSGVVLYTVEVALDPTDLPARAGMTADVEVVTRSAEDALLVPLKAVRSIDERTFVLRQLREGEEPPAPGAGPGQRGGGQGQPPASMGVSSGQAAGGDAMGAAFSALQELLDAGFVPAPVELGMITDVYAEITSGLEEGDVVSLATSSTTTTESGEPGGPPMPGMGFLGGSGRP